MEDVNLKYQLGHTLLQKLCKERKENFVFSPLSLGTAFAMLAAGLRGDTKGELLGFLGCKDEDTLHALYTGLVANKDLPLKIANKYVAQKYITVHKKFSELLKDKYHSEVESVDFLTEGRAVEERVNAWVARETNDMIKSLLPNGSLTQDTILVLLNAVYFKGTWTQEFKPLDQQLNFTLRDGTVVKKNFMTKTSKEFSYHETEKLRLAKIPYNEAGCYMVVAMPADEKKHIDEILLDLTTADLASAVHGLNHYAGPKVDLTIPKFKIEYNFGDIKTHMEQLGVNKIFRAGVGDFGDMFSDSEMKQVPSVTDVIHRSVVEIDEKGTRAAAATAVRIMARCGSFDENFLVDRPFYFGIFAGSDGFCLFQGLYSG